MLDGQLYKRFTVVTVLATLAVLAVTIALDMLFDVDVGGGVGIVTLIVPAMDAGGTYVRKTGELLEKARMWRMAVMFFLINIAVGLVIFLAVFLVSGENVMDVLSQIGPITLLLILVVVAAIFIPVARFSLSFGAKQALKLAQK